MHHTWHIYCGTTLQEDLTLSKFGGGKLLDPSSNFTYYSKICSDFTGFNKLEIRCIEILHLVSRGRNLTLRTAMMGI